MRVLSVVGARPSFVKVAPVSAAMTAGGIEHLIVHTGQHYDADMSDQFFSELRIPDIDVHLAVGSGSHGIQTAAMLAALEPVFQSIKPEWVLVYGDTNSTIAGALAAVKIHIPLAHLEAGLRSHNRRMPEEHNRVLTDHAADLCLAPTELAMRNLADEGLIDRSRLVGDVMTDICFQIRDRVLREPIPVADLSAGQPFVLATIHRPENTENRERLSCLLKDLAAIDIPVILPAHPRLIARAKEFQLPLDGGSLRPVAPLGYPAMVSALLQSVGIVTDSGGLQKEAYLLERTCTTLRRETEWPETLVGGWNVLRPDCHGLLDTIHRPQPDLDQGMPFGRGDAAAKVVAALSA